MFMPTNKSDEAEAAAIEKRRREAFDKIEKWGMDAIPAAIRGGVQISVQEVQCGDPTCAPIDTAIVIVFPSGGRGMMGLPMEAHEVTKELLATAFPTEDVLNAWSRGEEADWPPLEEFDDNDDDDAEKEWPPLRFPVGTRVECRVSAEGWAPGEVVQLWYREPGWPPNSWAPYKIRLDDGRNIFAPGDIDQIIRSEQGVNGAGGNGDVAGSSE